MVVELESTLSGGGMTMTAQETAEYLNITHQMLRHYLRNQKLKGRRVGHIWLIEKKDADSFKEYLQKHSR